jgi:hypothetical protein
LKNERFKIEFCISLEYHKNNNISEIEYFISGRSGNITIAIIANLIVLFSSSELTLLVIFSINGDAERRNVSIIERIIATSACPAITNTQRKNVMIAEISVVSPICFSLNAVYE